MLASEIKCRLCGQDMWQASGRGAFLKRVNPVGEPFVGECVPSCDRKHGNQDDALLAAVRNGQ